MADLCGDQEPESERRVRERASRCRGGQRDRAEPDLYIYGLHSYGLHSYGLHSYGLYSCGLYRAEPDPRAKREKRREQHGADGLEDESRWMVRRE